jgi:hypothetical protein
MGSKLSKEQALSERTKLCPIKAHVFLKSGPREMLSELEKSEEWNEIFLTIHQSHIYASTLDTVKIDKNLLILSQDQSKFEVKLISISQDPAIIYIIRCKSIWQFKDFVLAIFFSKRPSWILFQTFSTMPNLLFVIFNNKKRSPLSKLWEKYLW